MTSIKMNYETCLCEGCKIYRKEKGIREPVDKYEAEVRRIAEILVDQFYNQSPGEAWYESRIKEVDLSARAMVAEMAKVYEHAYFSNYPGDEDSEDYALWNQNCISEMEERGLIPAPENKNNA